MSTSSLPAFGPTCPKGGSYYACSTGSTFVGCCGSFPCGTNGCPLGNLYPASFDASKYGSFPDASCPAGSTYYTCTGTKPVFMGCCKTGTNPCQLGSCAGDALVPAYLGTDQLRMAYGAVGASSSSSVARTSSTATVTSASTLATMASGTSSPTSASQASAAALPTKDSPPVAAIAGGAAGGAFAIALVIGLLIYYCCHAKKSRKDHEETVVRRESDLPAMLSVQGKDSEMKPPDAPPGYVSPNPNDYYGAHAHAQVGRYHQYIPEPQELSGETHHHVAGFASKPRAHQRNVSELSGETAIRSEMDTPSASPHVAKFSSPSQPHAGWENSPGGFGGSPWTPQQNWQTQTGGESYAHGPAQGLGVNGIDTNHQTTTH